MRCENCGHESNDSSPKFCSKCSHRMVPPVTTLENQSRLGNDDTKPALTFENKSKHGETPSIEIASTTVSDEAEDTTIICCRTEDESTDAKTEEDSYIHKHSRKILMSLLPRNPTNTAYNPVTFLQKRKEKKSQEQMREMREISGTSSNGGKPVKGGTIRRGDPADLISVYFHVLVSKDFELNPENAVVVKAAQVEGYRDWTDTVCCLYSRCGYKSYLLYEGRTEISKKNLDKSIPYKYVICHEKKEEEYEFIYKNDCKAGITVNRCLHIPSKLLSNQREWHQYDDVCMKRDDGYINKAYTLMGWNKSTIFEGKKLAGNIMLDGIFSFLTDCDSNNLSSFLNQLHQFYYVSINSLVFEDEPTAWKSHGFGEKELINLIMGKLYQHLINKNLSAADAIIKDRLMAGLLCAKLIENYSLPADKNSLVKVCRLLSLEQMLNKNLPIQLEELKRIFSVYEGIEYSLKLFCMRCIDDKIEDWVQILPVYHTFNTPAKPEDSTQLKPEENWAGLDRLPYQTIVIRSKFYNRDVQKYMMREKSLQQAGRTLHRSWLCLLPLENLFMFLDTIPTDFRDAFTAAWYKFHTQSSSSKDKHIEKILTKLLNMAEGLSQGSLQKDSIYLCNISLKLHHLICTQTGLNKNSQLPLLSFKIALKLFGAAQKQEPMKGRETNISEVQSNLNKAVEMMKTWLQDFFGHRFNFRRYGYPTFGNELEFWNKLLMNDDNMDLKWKELLLSDLARKIKEESPVEQIKIYCREHSLLQRLHISIEECFEECAINAVHNAYKSHNNILDQISINDLQHFRKLVSTIIRNSWLKDVQGNPTENNNEILKHMLHWKDFTHIFKLYDPNQPITSQFIEETQKLVALSDSVLLDTVCRLMHGDILYEHLKLVLDHENQFLDICRLRLSKGETIKVEEVKKVLEWRNEELKTVNCKKTWLENLLKTCQNISKSVRAEWIQDDPVDGEVPPPPPPPPDQAAPPAPDEAAPPPPDEAAPPPPPVQAAPPPHQAAPPADDQGLSVGTQTEHAYYDQTELLVTIAHQVNAMRQELGELRDMVESGQRVVPPPPPPPL